MTIKKGILDEQVIDLHSQGLNDVEIAMRLGCTAANIFRRRKKLKLKSNFEISDEKIINLYNKGLNDRQIAEKVNRDESTICVRRHKLKLEAKHEHEQKIDRNKVKSLYGQGLSDTKIAKELNCSQPAISRIRRELNLSPYFIRKLEISIDEVKERWELGLNDRQIAGQVGCSRRAIQKIRKKLGLKSKWYNSDRKFTDEQLTEDINKGLSDKQISKKHKCSLVAVFLRRKKLKILINSVYLTDQDLLDAYNSGKFGTDKELARYLGYCELTIRNRRHKLGLKPLSARGRRQSGEPVEKAIVTVTEKTREDLKKLKKQGETYTDVVEKLIEEVTRDESD